MYRVSFLEWLRTGQFGPVSMHMLREEIGQLLGPPEYTGYASGNGPWPGVQPDCWLYGNIEFWFDRDADRLTSIFVYTDREIDGGSVLAPDREGLEEDVPFARMMAIFRAAGVHGTQYFPSYYEDQGLAYLETDGGVGVYYVIQAGPHDGPLGLIKLLHIKHLEYPPGYPRRPSVREPRRF